MTTGSLSTLTEQAAGAANALVVPKIVISAIAGILILNLLVTLLRCRVSTIQGLSTIFVRCSKLTIHDPFRFANQ
jgi:hypothetical protein